MADQQQEPNSCALEAHRVALARVEHRLRVWRNCQDAAARSLAALQAGCVDLALVRDGYQPKPGFDGDAELARAQRTARKEPDKPVEFREHPIEAMFRKGQLRPEWRWLFEQYVDLAAQAEGGSEGVVDLQRTVVQVSGVPDFSCLQMEAIHAKESKFMEPIRRRAGEVAAGVFDMTHRFGRQINSVMSVSALGADGRFGRRNQVGKLLQKAYEALAEEHGITAAHARRRYFRDGPRPVASIVQPLSAAELAEIEAWNERRLEAKRTAEAKRFEETKDHAANLQRQRRAGVGG